MYGKNKKESILKPNCLFQYRYENRIVPYRTENIEISPNEMFFIKSIQPTPVTEVEIPPLLKNDITKKVKIIIDTDIGTDLDDALAVLYALGLKNVELLGITTNYGPTLLRARIAEKICIGHARLYNKPNPIPVIAGSARPVGSHRTTFLSGEEGNGIIPRNVIFSDLETESLKVDPKNVTKFISDTIKKYPNEVKIVSIGIPTNIALTLYFYPEIETLINEIVFMGPGSAITVQSGRNKFAEYDNKNKITKIIEPFTVLPETSDRIAEFVKSGNILNMFTNQNFSGDSLASKIVFMHKNLRIRIIPSTVTHKFWLTGKSIQYLQDTANKLKMLRPGECQDPKTPLEVAAINLDRWFRCRNGNGGGQCPHDPLVVHETVYNGDKCCLKYVPGTLVVHEWASNSTFIPHLDGKHLLAVEIKPQQADEFLTELESILCQTK